MKSAFLRCLGWLRCLKFCQGKVLADPQNIFSRKHWTECRETHLGTSHYLSPGGGGGAGGFWYETSFKFLFPLKKWSFYHAPPRNGYQNFLYTPPPNFFTLHTPIISSVVVCRFFYYTYIHFPSVQSMYKCLKRLQENLDTNQLWKTENSLIKFKTHRYNTEFISGKTFDIEMNKNCLHHFWT